MTMRLMFGSSKKLTVAPLEKGDLCMGVHYQGRVYIMQCKDKSTKAVWTSRISAAIDEAKARAKAN